MFKFILIAHFIVVTVLDMINFNVDTNLNRQAGDRRSILR